MFVTNSGAGKVSESCITTWLSGIHRHHQLNNAPWLGGDILQLARKGAAANVSDEAARTPRSPITLTHIITLHTHLDLSNSFDAAVFAVACIAFWACCHLGELTTPSRNVFDPTIHVPCSTPIKSGTAREGRDFVAVHIPYSKTRKACGDDIQLIDIDHITNPITAFKNHMDRNPGIPNNAPLFAFRTADLGWAPMTKLWFMERCNEVWKTAGMESLAGHSFRIGGTTHLLSMGIDPWVVMVIGRWTSTAFVHYWRKIENIIPRFISSAHHSVSLSARMSRICQGLNGH